MSYVINPGLPVYMDQSMAHNALPNWVPSSHLLSISGHLYFCISMPSLLAATMNFRLTADWIIGALGSLGNRMERQASIGTAILQIFP